MNYPIRITKAARRDLEEIYTWIAEHDSVSHADHVLDRVAQIVENITTFPERGSRFPERGSRPQELRPGMRTDCRQVFFKPYRVIYQVRPTEVVIVLIADGRRNLQSLLLRRLRKD